MNVQIHITGFFESGGTLSLDAPSYVKRPADDELLRQTMAGQFCYVLTSRQMGKSSLMMRTVERLKHEKIKTAIVDLSELGTNKVSSCDQWYCSIIDHLIRKLEIVVEFKQWWDEYAELSAAQRFRNFLNDVILAQVEGKMVIFIDEIDSTLKLDFTDDFFAVIRHTYNLRASNAEYNRLTFVLLGVAVPTDLIKDRNRTPFNIGTAIGLYEFSRKDAQPLEDGLELIYPGKGAALLDQVFAWTHGHPYLTQRICQAISETTQCTDREKPVDHIVESLFLLKDAQKEKNLQFVRSQIEASRERVQLLRLYQRIYKKKNIPDDERSPVQNRLKLIGLVRCEGSVLCVRNAIYRKVFTADWARKNMPTNWAQIITTISTLIAIGAIIFSLSMYQSARRETVTILKDQYVQSSEADAKMYYLYELCGIAQAEALDLFLQESPKKQNELFEQVTAQDAGERLVSVVDCLSPAVDQRAQHSAEGETLRRTMCCALHRLNEKEHGQWQRNCTCTTE